MPTYVYLCKNCAHEFERLQKISDEPLVQCPNCSQNTVVRIIQGGAGMVFKGSGFYLTDYKKTNTSSATKSETPSSSKTEAKSASTPETTSESKSATASESKSETKSSTPPATGTASS